MLLDRERRVRGPRGPQLTIRIKKTPMANTQPVPANTLVVGRGSNIGVWNQTFSRLADLGYIKDLHAKMVLDQKGVPWAVGLDGNFLKWNGSNWTDYGLNWTLKMIAFDPTGILWGVGVQHNVGIWDGKRWNNRDDLGDWDLKMLVWDQKGSLWCVGMDGNVGKWKESDHGWENQPALGTSNNMLAFDNDGIWRVDTDGNVGFWNGTEWQNQDLGWNPVKWIAFPT